MSKYLIDAVLAILLFVFLWKVIGKALVRWTATPDDILEGPPVATADELRRLRALLTKRIAKLKDKAEIAQAQDQLNKVNEQLADLA